MSVFLGELQNSAKHTIKKTISIIGLNEIFGKWCTQTKRCSPNGCRVRYPLHFFWFVHALCLSHSKTLAIVPFTVHTQWIYAFFPFQFVCYCQKIMRQIPPIVSEWRCGFCFACSVTMNSISSEYATEVFVSFLTLNRCVFIDVVSFLSWCCCFCVSFYFSILFLSFLFFSFFNFMRLVILNLSASEVLAASYFTVRCSPLEMPFFLGFVADTQFINQQVENDYPEQHQCLTFSPVIIQQLKNVLKWKIAPVKATK